MHCGVVSDSSVPPPFGTQGGGTAGGAGGGYGGDGAMHTFHERMDPRVSSVDCSSPAQSDSLWLST